MARPHLTFKNRPFGETCDAPIARVGGASTFATRSTGPIHSRSRSERRRKSTLTARLILSASSRRTRSATPVTGLPSSAITMSPVSRPACAAGPALVDVDQLRAVRLRKLEPQRDAARDRRRRGGDADRGAADAAVARDLAGDEIGGVGGDREADALRAHDDRRVDADHLAGRGDQRAAGIAGIERRVGLHDVLDHAAGARLQRAAERGDDAGRHRRVEAERIADRDRDLAAPQLAAVAEPRGGQGDGFVDAQQREVGVGIVAEHARLIFAPLERRQRDGPRALHDMAVGQREAVGRDDHAGAGAAALAGAADVDPHDARADAVDDVGDDARIGVERRIVGDADETRRGRCEAPSASRAKRKSGGEDVSNMARIWEPGRATRRAEWRAASIPAPMRPHPLLRRLAHELLDARLNVRGRDADVGLAVGGPGNLDRREFDREAHSGPAQNAPYIERNVRRCGRSGGKSERLRGAAEERHGNAMSGPLVGEETRDSRLRALRAAKRARSPVDLP